MTVNDPEDPARRPRRWILQIVPLALLIYSALILLAMILLPELRQPQISVPLLLMIIAVLWWVRYQRHWLLPRYRILQIVPKIMAGEAPLDELPEETGPMKQVNLLFRQLLHERRLHRQNLAELDQEMRQRIAQRTESFQRLLGSLRQQAARDPLTNLFNRRVLDSILPRLLDRCRSERLDLSLIMIDVDHFKHVNDTLGHAQGDVLLRDIGRLIRSSLREHDAAFRYGGDEFLIVLPGSPERSANVLARRLTDLTAGLVRPLKLTPCPALCCGIVTLHEHPRATVAELIRIVDERMYDRKRNKPRGSPLAKAS